MAMDFHLERKLQVAAQSVQTLTDRWIINEIDQNDQIVGGDYIPFDWSLIFTATEIVLHETIKVTKSNIADPVDAAHQRLIQVSLSPGSGIDDVGRWGQTTYRMFGTDRIIKKFALRILPLRSEDEIETCSAYGCVSFTSKAEDLLMETESDVIEFSLMVRPSTFGEYANHISAATVDEMILNVKGVAGFYSEWSPTISTRNVKVLTQGEEHQSLQIPADFKVIIPRLGSYLTTTLQINTKRVPPREPPTAINDDMVLKKNQSMPRVRSDSTIAPEGLDPKTINLIRSLKTAAHWIIALLALLVITTLLKRE
jgi:hypothetical protein